MTEAVKLLGELLSRSNLDENYSIDNAEAAHLAAILEIKVSINYISIKDVFLLII